MKLNYNTKIKAFIKTIFNFSDINKIKDGIGDKFGNGVQYVATFFIAVLISLIKGWKLTLVILSVSPLIFISSALFTQVNFLLSYSFVFSYFLNKILKQLTTILTSNELKSYARAGAVAEEVFTAIRTVFAFNGVKKEHKRSIKILKSYLINLFEISFQDMKLN